MKFFFQHVIIFMVSMVWSKWGCAQIIASDVNPFATVTQKMGLDEVRIEYTRPSVHGRVIFGEVVPFGKVWHMGDSPVKIFVGETLTVEDKYKITPGIYSLYAVPDEKEWGIIMSKDLTVWSTFGYSDISDAVTFNVKPRSLKDQVETFTIQFANVCNSCAEIQILWDYTIVSFRISTDVDKKVLSDIEKITNKPEGRLAGEYYLAAKYYYDTNRDLPQALEWTDKALEYGPNAYWVIHLKAEIQAKMGDYRAAIETAALSKEKAKEKNDEDYVKRNEQEIAKWRKVKKTK